MFNLLPRSQNRWATALACISLLPLLSTSALAQQGRHHRPSITIPHSSQTSPNSTGHQAHTNIRFFFMNGSTPSELPPYAGYAYETPASLACVYRLVRSAASCNPNETTTDSTGGSDAIAIVDAYDDPYAASDLAAFSEQFGLPQADFKVVYAPAKQPPVDPTGGWELEESLDIEYAHAMAPKARIYLVEAKSNDDSDLYAAVQVAGNLILCGTKKDCKPGSNGKGQVSMSWGGPEDPTDSSADGNFTTPNVEYFAASGDAAGTIYPCTSVNVICVGGTSIARNENNGNYIAEIAWSDAGGGISSYEPVPRYQSTYPGLARQLQGYRGVPDVSAVANPETGVWVLDNFPYEAPDGFETGWFIVGGTSLATPVTAALFNTTGSFENSSYAALSDVYSLRNLNDFRDITYGACGFYSGSFSSTGWDLCTGFGSPTNLNIR